MAECNCAGAALALLLAPDCPAVAPATYPQPGLVPPGTLAEQVEIGSYGAVNCRLIEIDGNSGQPGFLKPTDGIADRRPWDTERYDFLNPPDRLAMATPVFCAVRRVSAGEFEVIFGGPGLPERVKLLRE